MDSALAKKLAREARKLAMECVNGTAPRFTPDSFCGCAIGEMVANATGTRPTEEEDDAGWVLASEVDDLMLAESGVSIGLVSLALIETPPEQHHDAVVFPLLALADALDEAADG